LQPEPPLMFAGYNPGGDVFSQPSASVEAGNAYRVEHWPQSLLHQAARDGPAGASPAWEGVTATPDRAQRQSATDADESPVSYDRARGYATTSIVRDGDSSALMGRRSRNVADFSAQAVLD
jgi:hypothetical protein